MRFSFLLLLILIFVIPFSVLAFNSKILINRIEGRVYGPDHMPVEKIYVELRNEVDSMVGQSRTDISGRFTFAGMSSGRYTIRALSIGTEFKEQTQEINIVSLQPNSSDIIYTDIYLVYNKRDDSNPLKSPEAIFVQEIPASAKKLYEEGISSLSKNPNDGLLRLEEALKIFPTYFDALNMLGKEYISHKDYEKAYPYLIRAIDVNPRSSINFYRLSIAFYQIKQYSAALEAAKAATVLVSNSIDAQLLYGTILRITEDFSNAEKTLLKANALAKTKNSDVHWQLALLYNRLKRNAEAVNELEEFLRIEPNSPDKAKIQDLIAKLKSSEIKSK